MTKRIGILTSGGDCAGLNAVIRAIVCRAHLGFGWEVLGIHQGTKGLMDRPVGVETLGPSRSNWEMLHLGGTVLGTTNQGDPFAYPMPDGTLRDRSSEVTDGYKLLGLDALIGIGGDGSLAILRKLATQGGWNLIGIPKTIDNDIGLTEQSIGYDTAVAVATEALDRLAPTAASHSRVMILEVMGRDAGHIALAAGIAGGADVILIPEVPYTLDAVAAKIEKIKRDGRNFALVIAAEALPNESGNTSSVEYTDGAKRYGGIGAYLGERIAQATGAETRVTVLGHVQRGSMPTAPDRLLASMLGVHAVELIATGASDRMVAWWHREIIDVPIADAIAHYQCVDRKGALVRTARGLGICLGDAA
jgi:6-phosphofructokinase 1